MSGALLLTGLLRRPGLLSALQPPRCLCARRSWDAKLYAWVRQDGWERGRGGKLALRVSLLRAPFCCIPPLPAGPHLPCVTGLHRQMQEGAQAGRGLLWDEKREHRGRAFWLVNSLLPAVLHPSSRCHKCLPNGSQYEKGTDRK